MIILASGSPRRKELLEQIGAGFEVLVSDAAEESGDLLEPEELVRINAVAKAKAVAAEHPERPVLGADTVVSLDGHTYGKPCDKTEACRMLAAFSGSIKFVRVSAQGIHDLHGLLPDGDFFHIHGKTHAKF